MRKLKFTLLALFATTLLTAQSAPEFWTSVDEDRMDLAPGAQVGQLPDDFHTFELNINQLKAKLRQAPLRELADRQRPVRIDVPLANGQMKTFEVYETPTMMAKLQERYPNIRSYAGVAVDDPRYTARFDANLLGFYARISTPEGLMHIIPYATKQDRYYMSFFKRDFLADEAIGHKCGVEHVEPLNADNPIATDEVRENLDATSPYIQKRSATGIIQRTYRLAVASTAEYTQQMGSVDSVMSIISITANAINAIYERELAVSFLLIDNNDLLIQTDVNDQPYSDADMGRVVLGENHQVLVDIVGGDAFDIGHVFTIACLDGILGVAALGSLCNDNNKGTGVTCGYTSNYILMAEETMSHEIGHQFAASHSWNYCSPVDPQNPDDDPNVDENRSASTAFEPGSGSTIMSYAGVCIAGQNVKFVNDTYFHIGSHIQMFNHQQTDNVSDCGDIVTMQNEYPEVSVKYVDGFHIPINTPFRLTADATDADGDSLTYCWEQVNRHFQEIPLGDQTNTSPSFRSRPPSPSDTRFFPEPFVIIQDRISDVDDELLPSYTRNLKFRCSVRDVHENDPYSGIVWTDEVSFEADDAAGPFVVTTASAPGLQWEVGTEVEVTWDVANTDRAPVNSKFVDVILLPEVFTDNRNFEEPVMLAANVPNDGSQMVVVPDIIRSTTARVMVRSADNIFFNISNENLSIVDPTQPGFLFVANPFLQLVCLPTPEVAVDLSLAPLLGYDSLLNFSIAGLPTGAVAAFSANPARPSEGVDLTIDMSTVSFTGISDITISAEGPNLPLVERVIQMDFVDTDFSALTLSQPNEGTTGSSQVPTFSWADVPNADSYNIEIATNPAFDGAIIDAASGLTDNSYTTSVVLEKSTIYYWRVFGVNACGVGSPTPINTFQTETLNCSVSGSGEQNLPVPPQANQVVESTFTVPAGGAINDLNVANVSINFAPINGIRLELTSPDNKKAVLFDGNCSPTNGMDIGFDSDAPISITDFAACPPISGGVFRPVDDLSTFNNDNAAGEWKMTLTVLESGFSPGTFSEWSLEICSNSSVTGPSLITNETLPVKTNDGQWIANIYLQVTDPNQPSTELEYTLVEGPEFGYLERDGGPRINIGDTFLQSDLDNKNIGYYHDGSPVSEDGFFFTVNDGEGGYISKTRFEVGIDANNLPLSVGEVLDVEWSVFPNPATEQVNLSLGQATQEDLTVSIVNIQGQLVERAFLGRGQQILTLPVAHWPVGMYFVEISNGQAVSTEKVVIQR
ncbi:MAG: reprolysin-like metallopeptidase [Bacteroidota bacterium]